MTEPAPLSALVSGMLAGLGVVATSERDRVEAAIADELTRRGVTGQLLNLRHGVADILTTPADAALLRYDLTDLTDAVAFLTGGEVTDIRLRTRAPRVRMGASPV